MKRTTLNLIAFACAIAAPHPACAQVTCPPTLAVEQKTSAPAPGWTVTYSGYNTALAGVTIFEGPPAEQASLVPDREQTTTDRVFPNLETAGKRPQLLAAVRVCECHGADLPALAGECLAMRGQLRAQRSLRRGGPPCSQERGLQIASR